MVANPDADEVAARVVHAALASAGGLAGRYIG
jgi:hypothetical protein